MINGFKIKTIQDVLIKHKTVLVRVDFNVTLTPQLKISDDLRIRQSLPTLNYLLKNDNKLIIISHLSNTKKGDKSRSLKPVAKHLQSLIKNYSVVLIDDFLSKEGQDKLQRQNTSQVVLLENIRFYKGEEDNNQAFAKKLSRLADIYVNDAFGVSHRKHASIVSITKHIPSYAGLLLKHEVETIMSLTKNPKKPVVSIIGGAKISTKIKFLRRLVELSDYILLGGGIANTFLAAKGAIIGKSLYENSELHNAIKIISFARKRRAVLMLPTDAICGNKKSPSHLGHEYDITQIPHDLAILDIGPRTKAEYGKIINKAQTIIWNGPMGYVEQEQYSRGTEFIFHTVTQNNTAFSLVGGGDTIAVISQEKHLSAINHLSTGGGAMIELIERSTLPGLEALKDL
ncbi:MAG: phosphoglycerate kinase [Candidatus Paceibacterota bacterium]